MIENTILDTLKRKYERISPELDERGRRFWAASEASELGHGGIQLVAQATGLGLRTIRRGCEELGKGCQTEEPTPRRIRRRGGCVFRSKTAATPRSTVNHGLGSVSRSAEPRRPDVTVTLDLQEHAMVGSDVD